VITNKLILFGYTLYGGEIKVSKAKSSSSA